jgi:putative heme-binding domain-containing protein
MNFPSHWTGFSISTSLALGIAAGTSLLAATVEDPEASSLRVLPGFRLQRFADERLGVIKPTQVRFDGDGRLWVTTTTSYPQIRPGQEPKDRIVVLEDTDGDGQADRSTVFAEDLHIPLGIELGDGGAYVGSADELLFLRDTDGDGKADERRVVFSGFGTGDTHQTINSFTWGPSGELILSQGLHAISRIETPSGNVTLRQAGVWRFWPHSLRLDPFWDGAMGPHNPFGTVFDRNGRALVFAGNGHGLYDLTPAMVPRGHFLLQPALWSEGRKFGGADIADTAHWPEASRNEYLAGGYLQNTVERFRITPSGSSFRAERLPPLVETTNSAFRVVDLRFGPDGALYLCDWYNPIIGHYQASFRHPDRDSSHGRIWRISAKDRKSVIAPKLEHAPIPVLLEGLLSPERWIQLQSARLLRSGNPGPVEAALRSWLAGAASPADRRDRIAEMVGILTALDRPDLGLLEELAQSPHAAHRSRAARHCGLWAGKIPDPLPLLARLAADPEPSVRLEAVVACAWIPTTRSMEVAAIAADQALDGPLQYAFTQCVHALKPHWLAPFREGRLDLGGKENRAQALSNADRSEDSARRAAERLRRKQEVALDAPTQWSLVENLLAAPGSEHLQVLLAVQTYTVGTNYLPNRHADALQRLALSISPGTPASEGAVQAMERLLDSGATEVRGSVARLAGTLQIPSLESTLARWVESQSASEALRADAIRGLGGYRSTAHTDRIQAAVALHPGSDSIAEASVIALAGPAPIEAARIVGERLSGALDPSVADRLIGALLLHRTATRRLTEALRIKPAHPTSALAGIALLARSGRNEPELVQAFRVSLEGNTVSGIADLKSPGPALDTFLQGVQTGGDPIRGKQVFHRPELGCASCHGIGATSPRLGPDLSALGTSQTPAFLVGAILEPQREVKEGFNSWMLTMKDGTIHQGRLVMETRTEVLLFDAAERQELRLPVSLLADRTQIGSIMPEGLVQSLTREEFRDLIRFLSGLGRKE